MGTRALVDFIDQNTGESKRLYYHHDGDPEYVGLDLRILVANLNAGWRWGYYGDSIVDLAEYIQNRGLPTPSGVDHDYRDGSNAAEDWIEYFYTISKSRDSYSLSCRDENGRDVTDRIPAYNLGDGGKRFEVRYIMNEDQYKSSFKKFRNDDLGYGREDLLSDVNGKAARITRVRDKKKSRWKFKPLVGLKFLQRKPSAKRSASKDRKSGGNLDFTKSNCLGFPIYKIWESFGQYYVLAKNPETGEWVFGRRYDLDTGIWGGGTYRLNIDELYERCPPYGRLVVDNHRGDTGKY